MPHTKEQKKEWYKKNKEKILEQKKEYYENNKEAIAEYGKEYRENNKDKKAEYDKKYKQSEAGKKSSRICNWINSGVICDDFDSLYEYYLNVEFCEECNVELVEGKFGSNKKCLDHDHVTGEFRNVLCQRCNVKRR